MIPWKLAVLCYKHKHLTNLGNTLLLSLAPQSLTSPLPFLLVPYLFPLPWQRGGGGGGERRSSCLGVHLQPKLPLKCWTLHFSQRLYVDLKGGVNQMRIVFAESLYCFGMIAKTQGSLQCESLVCCSPWSPLSVTLHKNWANRLCLKKSAWTTLKWWPCLCVMTDEALR